MRGLFRQLSNMRGRVGPRTIPRILVNKMAPKVVERTIATTETVMNPGVEPVVSVKAAIPELPTSPVAKKPKRKKARKWNP